MGRDLRNGRTSALIPADGTMGMPVSSRHLLGSRTTTQADICMISLKCDKMLNCTIKDYFIKYSSKRNLHSFQETYY